MSASTQDIANSLLDAIVDAPTEAECLELLDEACDAEPFWYADHDLTSSTLAAACASVAITRTFVASLALLRLLRKPCGHERPQAKWIANAEQKRALDAARFFGSFAATDGVVRVPDAPAIDFAADRATCDRWNAFVDKSCADATRAGSTCYPCFPAAFIDGDEDDERTFSDGPVGIDYVASNDVLYAKRRGSKCGTSHECEHDVDVILSFEKGSNTVVGLTLIGASRRRTEWATHPDRAAIPADLFDAVQGWMET